MKVVKVYNIPDFKDENGLWIKSYCPAPNAQHSTRAEGLWYGINTRCKVGGACQKQHPNYIGCSNGFKDFQEFAEWCQTQYGYMYKEKNGKHWQLDKDLKVYSNKVYSKETCIFVPNRVNALLTASNASRGNYPIGVDWQDRRKKYRGQCSLIGKYKNLGYFDCPFEAHQAWQKCKVELIRKVCVEDEEIRNHLELVPILLAQAQRIEDDLLNNRETM